MAIQTCISSFSRREFELVEGMFVCSTDPAVLTFGLEMKSKFEFAVNSCLISYPETGVDVVSDDI